MEANVQECRAILNRFLDRWPVDNIIKMRLNEYVGLENPDTFCQWVETKTRLLGSINGEQSKKFGIYKRRDKEARPANMRSDEQYSWGTDYGLTRKDAFYFIIQDIEYIAKLSSRGEFFLMEGLSTDHMMAWKVAFLYSGEKLIPIFKKSLLYQIAADKGMEHPHTKKFWEIYQYIYLTKPVTLDVYTYAASLLLEYGKDKPQNPNYYIIGSKYGEHNNKDVFPEMLANEVVSTGFAWNSKYGSLWHASQTEITRELKKRRGGS